MKIRLRRVAVASVLAVAVVGAGAAPGAVASEPASARDGAVAVQRLHDELAEAVTAGDAPAIRWTLGELTPLLTEMDQRYELTDGGRELVATASTEAEATAAEIEALLSQKGLPSVPELLNMLLQKLLKILSELINNLLAGGSPLPL
jgi:hypothetical protein